jgi:hypothetical protein
MFCFWSLPTHATTNIKMVWPKIYPIITSKALFPVCTFSGTWVLLFFMSLIMRARRFAFPTGPYVLGLLHQNSHDVASVLSPGGAYPDRTQTVRATRRNPDYQNHWTFGYCCKPTYSLPLKCWINELSTRMTSVHHCQTSRQYSVVGWFEWYNIDSLHLLESTSISAACCHLYSREFLQANNTGNHDTANTHATIAVLKCTRIPTGTYFVLIGQFSKLSELDFWNGRVLNGAHGMMIPVCMEFMHVPRESSHCQQGTRQQTQQHEKLLRDGDVFDDCRGTPQAMLQCLCLWKFARELLAASIPPLPAVTPSYPSARNVFFHSTFGCEQRWRGNVCWRRAGSGVSERSVPQRASSGHSYRWTRRMCSHTMRYQNLDSVAHRRSISNDCGEHGIDGWCDKGTFVVHSTTLYACKYCYWLIALKADLEINLHGTPRKHGLQPKM